MVMPDCQRGSAEGPWIEYGYQDPESIPWAKIQEALTVMGIDTTMHGGEIIELHIQNRIVEIRRARISVDGRHALWTTTKEILIS